MNTEPLLKFFAKFVTRYRWPLLIFLIILALFLTYRTQFVVMNNDYDTWLPANEKVTVLYKETDRIFSSNAMVFAVLDFEERGVFHPESLELIKHMTLELESLDELFNVTSLTNIMDIRKVEDGVEVSDLIPEIPEDEQELNELKEYVLSKEMYVNSIVSEDARYAVLVTNIDGQYDEIIVAGMVLEKIKEIAGDTRYYFGGDPAISLYYDKYTTEDLASLVPMVLLAMVIVLAITLRRVLGILLPLGVVVLSIIFAFGLMPYFKLTANLMTPSVVVLLIAVGADYAVHIYNHYLKRGDIELSTTEITLPVVLSAVTTVVGLLTFATTKIEIFQFFGYELALGLAIAGALSLVLVPVCIKIFRGKPAKRSEVEGQEDVGDFISRGLWRFGGWVHNHTKLILIFTIILFVVMLFGIFRITSDIDFAEILPEDSLPRKGHDILKEEFSGIYPASMYFRGDIENPLVLKQHMVIENFMHSDELLSSFTSINDLIAEENWALNGIYATPDTREGVANLWLLLEGQEVMKTFITTDRTKSLITGMLKEPSTGAMEKVFVELRDYLNIDASSEIVRLDPNRLSPEGKAALSNLIIKENARQVAWLAQGYDKPRKFDPAAFESAIAKGFENSAQEADLQPVWNAAQKYLRQETVEILPDDLVSKLTVEIEKGWQNRNSPEFSKQLEEIIVASGVMDSEDAQWTVAGVLKRCEFQFRLQRVAVVKASYKDLLTPVLQEDKDFNKRAEGVLWELFTDSPVFFSSQVESIPGVKDAVAESVDIEIDQTGAPDMFTRFNELVLQSTAQSLVLASIIVLILVALSQRSIKRGAVSLLAVLVPIEVIIGLMGWIGIPLDFGTALFGALIVGLGVDGSIHFLHYYHHLYLSGVRGERALRATMGHVGKAIVAANATTICGFMVLIGSKTSTLRDFGIANSTAIFLVTLSVLTFLPALLTLMHIDENSNNSKNDK